MSPAVPPIVLLHGWTMRGRVFEALRRALPEGVSSHAPDLPGHGGSPDATASLDAAADMVERLVSESSPGPVLLVGWSMGAAVAWRYVARHGQGRLAGLMTVDMSPKIANDADWPNGLVGQSAEDVARTSRRMETDWRGTAEAIATTMFAHREGAPGFSRAKARTQILSNDPAKMLAYWRELAAMDLREVVPQVSCPVLAACGVRSKVYPISAAEWIAAASPAGRLHRFEKSGHSPHLEEPDAFRDCLLEFWRSL